MNILQKNKMRRVKQHTKQKNNNNNKNKIKIKIIMDGFNFHYRIGCLITLIWMDGIVYYYGTLKIRVGVVV